MVEMVMLVAETNEYYCCLDWCTKKKVLFSPKGQKGSLRLTGAHGRWSSFYIPDPISAS